ncbi:hypothetical protein CMZ84_08355, partial [Lysobacteraceae bacterium NML93-0399]
AATPARPAQGERPSRGDAGGQRGDGKGERGGRNGQRRDRRGNRQGQGAADAKAATTAQGAREDAPREPRRDTAPAADAGARKERQQERRQRQKQRGQRQKTEGEATEAQATTATVAPAVAAAVEAPRPTQAEVASPAPAVTAEAPSTAETRETVHAEAAAPTVDTGLEDGNTHEVETEGAHGGETGSETGDDEGGNGRRRRGRRGGRRRRRGKSGESAAGDEGTLDADDQGDDEGVVSTGHGQPEFDFDDLPAPGTTPADAAPATAEDAQRHQRAAAAALPVATEAAVQAVERLTGDASAPLNTAPAGADAVPAGPEAAAPVEASVTAAPAQTPADSQTAVEGQPSPEAPAEVAADVLETSAASQAQVRDTAADDTASAVVDAPAAEAQREEAGDSGDVTPAAPRAPVTQGLFDAPAADAGTDAQPDQVAIGDAQSAAGMPHSAHAADDTAQADEAAPIDPADAAVAGTESTDSADDVAEHQTGEPRPASRPHEA